MLMYALIEVSQESWARMPAARFTFSSGRLRGDISVQLTALRKGTVVPDFTFLLTHKVFLKTLLGDHNASFYRS